MLMQQLHFVQKHCSGTGVSAFPEGESILVWLATINGVDGTPFEGRRFRCSLRFCPEVCGGEWPVAPPQLRMHEPLPHHPNIDPVSGAVCMDLLQGEWSCAGGVLAILVSLRSLIASPTMDDAAAMPANLTAARDWLTNRERCRALNEKVAQQMMYA